MAAGDWSNTGHTNYYVSGDMKPGFANFPPNWRDSQSSRFADADGFRWNSVWLGNVNSMNVVPSPAQWQSLLTIAILDGNRWFILFPQMSNGHFAPMKTTNLTTMATMNADVVYSLAVAANWFQPTSASLKESVYVPTAVPVDDPHVSLRLRVNKATGEAWFAAMKVGLQGPSSVTVNLPGSGTVTDLATGEKTNANQLFTLPLTSDAHPHYFRPGASLFI